MNILNTVTYLVTSITIWAVLIVLIITIAWFEIDAYLNESPTLYESDPMMFFITITALMFLLVYSKVNDIEWKLDRMKEKKL